MLHFFLPENHVLEELLIKISGHLFVCSDNFSTFASRFGGRWGAEKSLLKAGMEGNEERIKIK